jgi:hypothetical protein
MQACGAKNAFNRVSRTARQLARALARVANHENCLLDGVLVAILPRILVRARYEEGKFQVAKDSWNFLDSSEYAHLLLGLAACAEVAAGKRRMAEVGPKLGVSVRFNSKRYQEWAKTVPRLPPARNVPLCVLILGLRDLITKNSNGKLTLWEDPTSGNIKGTLPVVLATLRPHLPGIIPAKLNYRTLRRYIGG